MQNNNKKYFQNALSDFTYDVACGAQIRHLTDLGYTAAQIVKELDVSSPYGKVQETATKHLCETGVLISERPDSKISTKPIFVREYDCYGRASFRQVVSKEENMPEIHWQKRIYAPVTGKELLYFLNDKTKENGEEASYISCDFGQEKQKMEHDIKVLTPHQQEYIEGILWKNVRMYHRLTLRMREIIARLYENGLYEGECYFMQTGECVIL